MPVTLNQIVAGILGFNTMILVLGTLNIQNFAEETPTFTFFEDSILDGPWHLSTAWDEYESNLLIATPHQQLINDHEYCQKVEEYRKKYPVKLDKNGMPQKNDKVIFSDFGRTQFPKQVYDPVTRIVMRQHFAGMNDTYIGLEPIREDINMFFHLTALWHNRHKIGMHFLCEGQMYNHVPGNIYLSYKDYTAQRFREYYETYYADRPQCFNPWQVFPYSLVMDYEDQCLEFMNELKTNKQTQIKWVYKKSRGAHNGKGVAMVDQQTAKEILEEYENGAKCGKLKGYMVQQYVGKPFLLHGTRKFDFRAYMVIASMDPLIVLYHDGFLRISLSDFDENKGDATIHLTNTVVAENQLQAMNVTHTDEQKYLEDQGWSFDHFSQWLTEQGYDEDTMESVIKPKIKHIMLHIIRMNLDKLLKHPRVFEYFGLDFLLDTDFNIWYIELNLTPSIAGTSKEKEIVNKKFLLDLLDLQYARLYNGDFDKILAQSNYEYIYDGRQSGIERYAGLLTEECL